jgi:hypothetical protein
MTNLDRPSSVRQSHGSVARAGNTRLGRLVPSVLALVAILCIGIGTYVLWPRPLNTKTVCLSAGPDVSALTAFSKLAGTSVNCAVLFNDANPGWAQWVDPWFTHLSAGDAYWPRWIKADQVLRRVVVTQEMVPDNVSANWRVLGAAGAYDHYARELAVNLVAAGMGNAVIRLGHEMNGNWYHDSLGSNPAQYRDWATYWGRIVYAMRAVKGAHFLFDWNVNAGYRNIALSSFYPGDNVVNVIGIDIYDAGMPGNPRNQAARWSSLASEPDGPSQIIAFAHTHEKPLSFPEWGLVSAARGGGGDDVTYLRGIAAAIKDNNVVYQSYFDSPSDSVLALQNSPRSFSLWKTYFGSAGSLSGGPW